LALLHHDPDTASLHARAGALILVETAQTVLDVLNGLVEGLGAIARK
jgi:hypothetical protein